MKAGFLPQLPLELAFVESSVDDMTVELRPSAPSASPRQSPEQPSAGPAASELPAQPAPSPPPSPPAAVAESASDFAAPTEAVAAEAEISLAVVEENWRTILANLRQVDSVAQGLMNSVNLLAVEGNDVIVEASSELIRGRVEQPRVRSHAESCISQVTGTTVRLRCVVKGEYRPTGQSSLPPAPGTARLEDADQVRPDPEPGPKAERSISPSGASESHNDPMLQEGLDLGGVIREI
jgi:hypothetical protein